MNRPGAGWLALAFAWGAAEASVFFVVPDVVVTAVALRRGLGAGLLAAAAAALGAVAGGAAMYAFAAADPTAAVATVDAVPAISGAMIAEARGAFADGGDVALLRAAYTGVPYKIYAVLAGEAGRPLAAFLIVSLLVRASRFVIAAVLTRLAVATFGRRLGATARAVTLATFWLLFYAAYFATVG